MCSEQKKCCDKIGCMWFRLSASLEAKKVVGENVSVASPSPLMRRVRDLGVKMSHSRSLGDCIIHSTRSWSVRLRDVPMLRQRFRSCWGMSGDVPSADRRVGWVTSALKFSGGDCEGGYGLAHLLWGDLTRLRVELLGCGTVIHLRLYSVCSHIPIILKAYLVT